jgi:protein-tyrosine phosphatase
MSVSFYGMAEGKNGARPPRILFVCLGNIIRSPLCEGLLRHLVLPAVTIDSAAITNHDLGQHPAEHAQTIARKNGFDISSHISRLVTPADYRRFDIIVALEGYVYRGLLRMQPQGSKAIVRQFVACVNIANPWASRYADFEKTYKQIEGGMGPFIEECVPTQYRK